MPINLHAHLSVDGISVLYEDRRVLTDISFSARAGDRIGLIGENGTGKSTLLRVLAGLQTPDSGTIAVTQPSTVALLEQELPYPGDTPLTRVLDDAQAAPLSALREIERLGQVLAGHPADEAAIDAYAAALEAAEYLGAWQVESHRGTTLSGLGLDRLPLSRNIDTLSGGQRIRLGLASVLLRAPHVLLLDEPSNHLDESAVTYLERVLKSWPGIVIFASHDRALLDAVATKILDLDELPLPAHELGDAAPSAGVPGSEIPGSEIPGTVVPYAVTSEAITPRTSSSGAAASDSLPEGPGSRTEIINADPGSGFGARLWGVGYSAARAERAREMRRWRARYETELAERAALAHEIEVGAHEVNRKHESKSEARITRKYYADKDARVTARRARNARVRLEILERDRIRRPPEPLRFRGFVTAEDSTTVTAHTGTQAQMRSTHMGRQPTEESDMPMLTADRVAVPGRLRETSLTLEPGEHLLLSGPNGVGKSTLLAILAGALTPSTGTIVRRITLGYLPQEVEFAEARRSSSNTYRELVGNETADRIPLETLGLIALRDIDRPVTALSVGQRRRLALAALIAEPPQLLLLDEPTNHLSLTLVEELEDALRDFPGTLVVASHDRWLRSRWKGNLLELEPFQ